MTKMPYASPYEAVAQQADTRRVLYTDGEARAILVGANLIETATDRSLTEKRLRQLTSVDWKTLPLQWSVTTRRGHGRREIAIFSDPNCPFCRQFQKDLAPVDNLTVHIFMYPVVKRSRCTRPNRSGARRTAPTHGTI